MVEFGAGSQTKTPLLLDAVKPKAYVPIDISGDYLQDSAAEVDAEHERIAVYPVVGRLHQGGRLPGEIAGLARLGFFPGSTIGNFVPRSATDLLRHFRHILGTGARLLIGMDRLKPVERLLAAYDDPEGVTAEFNLNLLHRINRELGADIPVDAFVHEARWNDMLTRVEMHLVAHARRRIHNRRAALRLRQGPVDPQREQPQIRPARRPRCCCSPAAGRRSANGSHPNGDFAVILAEAQRNRFAP